MKKHLMIFAALLFVVIGRSGEADDKSWSGTVSTEFDSKYVGFGNGAVFYDKPMFESSIYVLHKSGFHADIWWGTGLNDNFSGGFDDEWDYNVGYSGSYKTFCYDVGIGYWDLVNTFHGPYNDMIHPFVELNRPFQVTSNLTLIPFAKWEGYLLPFGSDYEQGIIASGGLKYALRVHPRMCISGLTSVGYDDGGFGFETGFIWKDYTSLDWSLTKHVTLKLPSVQVYVPLGIADNRGPEVVWGMNVTYGF